MSMSTLKQKVSSIWKHVRKWFGLKTNTHIVNSTSFSRMPSIGLQNAVTQRMQTGVIGMDSSGDISQTESQNTGLKWRNKQLYIKKIIETPEGEVEFQANLSHEEVQFLLEFAINSLMKEGAIPFIDESKIDKISVQEHHPQ